MKTLYQIINSNTKKLPFYITTIGESVQERHIVRKDGFYSNHFLIILDGEGKFECEGKTYLLKKNDIIFIKKNVPHSYYPIKGEMHDLWITFDGTGVESLLDYYVIENYFHIQNADISKLIPDFEELRKTAKKGISQERISILFYNFAIEFLTLSKKSKEKCEISSAVKYIEENYANDITLEILSEICGLSKYSFCRIFKEEYLTTPFDYVLQVRIKNAKQILAENPSVKIKELSKKCGFNDECYFCRVFKRFEHCSPKQFVKTL